VENIRKIEERKGVLCVERKNELFSRRVQVVNYTGTQFADVIDCA
jgi:hypothetical protein